MQVPNHFTAVLLAPTSDLARSKNHLYAPSCLCKGCEKNNKTSIPVTEVPLRKAFYFEGTSTKPLFAKVNRLDVSTPSIATPLNFLPFFLCIRTLHELRVFTNSIPGRIEEIDFAIARACKNEMWDRFCPTAPTIAGFYSTVLAFIT